MLVQKVFKIKSFSRNINHIVTQHLDGSWECDCEYFNYEANRKNEYCDHIRKARHQKMLHHGRKALHYQKFLKAVKKYNHLCRKYRFVNEKYLYNKECKPKRVITIQRLEDRLKNYRKQIEKIIKAFPEIRKK